MLLFGICYAAVVRHVRKRDPNHGQTAWFVVVGVGVVVAAYGLLAGIDAALTLLGLFAAAGVPMVVEYVDSHTGMLQRRGILANLRSEDDGL